LRNPNGFGSIDKLTGRRRNPYRARKTIGYENGKQKRLTIGYFKTNKDAMKALFEQIDVEYSGSSFNLKEIYEMWKNQNFKNFAKNTITLYETAFRNLFELHDRNFNNIKLMELQEHFNSMNISSSSKRPIKSLLKSLYRYALTYELVDKDYASLIKLENIIPIVKRRIFTKKEINVLLKNYEDIIVSTILIMIYTGIRVGEMLTLKRKNINLSKKFIKCGIKTKAGKDRVIPIHPKIYLILNKLLDLKLDKTYLINMSYSIYRDKFNRTLNKIAIKPHTTHDCRHTFASIMSNADANQSAIKAIIGHSSFNTTEKIYIHKNFKELKKAINKIK
jgi:integrase